MKDWFQIPILLTLELVEVNANAIFLKCIAKYGGVLNEKLDSR
jgi:hypothetical protein